MTGIAVTLGTGGNTVRCGEMAVEEITTIEQYLVVLELTDVDMRKAYRMSLRISFVQKFKGWIERIDRDEIWACLSFAVMLEGGAMHEAK